jgi:hypothetical protein
MAIKILGFIVLLAAIAVIALFYHIATQTMWHDIMRDEYEGRYDAEIERRWKDTQTIRMKMQLVIIDETHKKEDAADYDAI